jgi:Na+/H+ antiporter NhaD/arsenite permease-like protein
VVTNDVALFIVVPLTLALRTLAALPAVAAAAAAADVDVVFGGVYVAGALLSQVISNVPAAIFLQGFTTDWVALAWGVNVGGFGLAIGSLANLNALRLARERGLWREFHLWSVPLLLIALGVGAAGLHLF